MEKNTLFQKSIFCKITIIFFFDLQFFFFFLLSFKTNIHINIKKVKKTFKHKIFFCILIDVQEKNEKKNVIDNT